MGVARVLEGFGISRVAESTVTGAGPEKSAKKPAELAESVKTELAGLPRLFASVT